MGREWAVCDHRRPSLGLGVDRSAELSRGPSLGSTMWLPEEDKYNMRRKELLDSLIVDMGGRVAEEIVFGDVTSGA